MLIWINGPFGVGKTTLAAALRTRLTDAVVADPEHVGMMLMDWGRPHGLGVADFQDLPLWRELVVTGLSGFHAAVRRDVVVPMTLLNPDYFEEVVGGLRARGVEVRHFCLTAPADEIRRRLATRVDALNPAGDDAAMAWATERLERYAPAMTDPRFETFLDATLATDDLAAGVVARLGDRSAP